MVDVAQLGYEVDTSQVLKGERALDELTESTLNADAASKRLGATSKTTGAAVGNVAARAANLNVASRLAGGGLRQVSLNLSQVAQQGAVTGNFLQALTVQAAAIGLVFGTAGIAIGALISVLGPSAIAFFNNADGARDFESAMDDLSDTIDLINRPLDVLNLNIDELIEKYGAAAQQVREFARVQAEIAIAQAQRRLEDQVDVLGDTLNAFTTTQDAGRDYLNTLARIEDQFGLVGDEARAFETTLQDLRDATGIEEQEQALQDVLTALEDADVELSKLPPELQAAISEMITLQRETAVAERLMQNLASAAAGVTIGDPRALDGLTGEELLPGTIGTEEEPSGRARRGGGVGRQTDRFEQDLNRLVQSLETERETIEREYAEREALLNDFRAREILGEQGHKDALLRLEQEYHEAVRQIGLDASDERLAQTAGFFGAMEQLALNSGKGLARAAAIFGGIEATINAYRAANQALADPSVPFLGKFAAYASVLATGLGAAKAISSAGSAVGAGGSGGAEGVSAAPAQVDQTVIRFEFVGSESGLEDQIFESFVRRAQASSREGVVIEVAR